MHAENVVRHITLSDTLHCLLVAHFVHSEGAVLTSGHKRAVLEIIARILVHLDHRLITLHSELMINCRVCNARLLGRQHLTNEYRYAAGIHLTLKALLERDARLVDVIDVELDGCLRIKHLETLINVANQYELVLLYIDEPCEALNRLRERLSRVKMVLDTQDGILWVHVERRNVELLVWRRCHASDVVRCLVLRQRLNAKLLQFYLVILLNVLD